MLAELNIEHGRLDTIELHDMHLSLDIVHNADAVDGETIEAAVEGVVIDPDSLVVGD